MKNVHVIPTDKPSRLFYNVGGALLFTNHQNHNGVNIHITSDEDGNEGDWVVTPTNDIIQLAKVFRPIGRKIILTTDQGLIKNGIQTIDDEFLEWFVKNPTCEQIEVEKGYRGVNLFNYKPILPQEEPNVCKYEK